MADKKVYFGGIPTDMDIQKLKNQYPPDKLTDGKIIPYEDVENILNKTRVSNRFKTVTERWRKIVLNDYNIIIGTKRSTGFKVLNDSEKLDLSGDKIKYAERSMRRSIIVSSKIERKNLSEHENKRLDMYEIRTSKSLAMLQLKSNTDLPTLE